MFQLQKKNQSHFSQRSPVALQEAMRSAEEKKIQLAQEEDVCNDTMRALWEECKPCLKNTCVKYYSRTCSSGSGLVGRQVRHLRIHFIVTVKATSLKDLDFSVCNVAISQDNNESFEILFDPAAQYSSPATSRDALTPVSHTGTNIGFQ